MGTTTFFLLRTFGWPYVTVARDGLELLKKISGYES